jgi:transcriptional regulator with XRE-family HTH domain
MARLFGAKLRLLRSHQEMSQAELARLLYLASRAHINNLEAGRRIPSLDLVLKVARIFGVTTDYLLRDTIQPEALPDHQTAYMATEQVSLRQFGEKLRRLRLQHARTQLDVAQHLELHTQAHISLLESGRSEPSLALVLKVADLFTITTDYLLRDDIPVQESTE